jgi:tRNA 2-selenouridine synthase
MINPVEPDSFLERAAITPVVDVRAPVEFNRGHIPGAVNIPLFDDRSRAAVGTVYKHEGHDAAVALGYGIANPRRQQYLELLASQVTGKEILLHCWRGGMRSAEMAKLFSEAGYTVHVLAGGYKAYRRYIRKELGRQAQVFILGGLTGSGKTELLTVIKNKGEQVIDLEQLASHKGSVFGALGQLPQPTNEQFENDLYLNWSHLDFDRPVWFEDESRMIGTVTLPDPLISHLNMGILVTVEMETTRRIERLVAEYALFGKTQLAEAIVKISERLGGASTREALEALEKGFFDKVAGITLAYYDKAYRHSMSRRNPAKIVSIGLLEEEIDSNVVKICESAYKHLKNGSHLPGL